MRGRSASALRICLIPNNALYRWAFRSQPAHRRETPRENFHVLSAHNFSLPRAPASAVGALFLTRKTPSEPSSPSAPALTRKPASQSVTNPPKLSHSGNNTLLLTYALTNASLYPALPLSPDKIWHRKSAPERTTSEPRHKPALHHCNEATVQPGPSTPRTTQCSPPRTQCPQRLCGISCPLQPLERRRKI